MAEKRLLLGDEAIALGAIHAGISGVYAYPGTPSTEITEFIQNNKLAQERNLHSTWCTNEKTAMEAALGMSYAGKRALTMCTVSDNVFTGEGLSTEEREQGFDQMIILALETVLKL